MKFLEGIAHGFYNEYRGRIGELCFIFPNRRSSLFFKKYLMEMVEKPLFAPHITTFKELIFSLSNHIEADRPSLLFDLYELYKELVPLGEEFDQFIYWGDIILNDFNDCDKFLVDVKQLFSNVKELKEIESDYSFLSSSQLEAIKKFWGGFLAEGGEKTKDSFIKSWEILYPLYIELNKKLKAKGFGYEGSIYREVANMENLPSLLQHYREVVFVGFNALNPCEKRVMHRLQDAAVADFYWDYNRSFIEDKENKAFHFISENLREFNSKREFFGGSERGERASIKVIGTSSLVMQAKITGELLKEFPDTEESAVVLPDESLLAPLLSSIPENISNINVTMGYPLAATPLISLVKMVAQMEWDQRGLYFKKVLPLLSFSFIHKVEGERARKIANRIKKENQIYVPYSFFEESELLSLIFERVDNVEKPQEALCDKLIILMDLLSNSDKCSRVEREFVFYIKSALNRVKGILIPMSIKTFGKVLSIITQGISIPFSGEPLTGLQVMGLLETRSLDFENLIICSMNEGIFPKKNFSNSFIPYNLRVGFNLPVKEYEDAIYTHLFYTLISRAKNVTLLYDTRSDGLKSGEPSRFILQLKYLYNMVEQESVVNYQIEPYTPKEIVVEKDSSVMKSLSTLLDEEQNRALSASSLNSYIDCPLKFYFSVIEGLEAPDEVEEGVEASEFGSIFHYAMEQLYSPFVGKRVTEKEINELLSNRVLIESVVDRAFVKYKNIEKPQGYSLLVKRMIIKYIEITLKYDKRCAPLHYVQSEKRVKGRVALKSGLVVPLKGFIDRIDRIEGISALRIIDYKTGKGDLKYSSVESLFDSSLDKRNKVAFQMYMYALLLKESQELLVEPLFMRELAKESFHREEIDRDRLREYLENLKLLLEEIFDAKKPFTQTKNRGVCDWCDFNSICY